MSRPQPDVPNDTTQQHPVANQSKHMSNAWKDPWDWNLDQQSDTQQQQQQHYVPPYQNQGPLISNSNAMQDHYFKNLNDNTSDVLNQNSMSDRNSPRSETTHQTGPNYADSFSPYANHNQNQQYPLPPRQNTTKSGYEPAQWPSEHQSQNTAYKQQRQQLVPQQNQKEQSPSHLPPVTSHNNWSKDDTANLSSQRNWHNHNEVLGLRQDQNMPKETQNIDNMNNASRQPPPQMYNAPVEGINKDYSSNWTANRQQDATEASNKPNAVPSQWYNPNREPTMTHHNQSTHLMQANNVDDTFNSWSQSGSISASHDWRHSNVQSDMHANQRLQQMDNNSFKENMSQDDSAKLAANERQLDQQQMHAAFPYTTTAPTVFTTLENIVHRPNNNEQQENEKHMTASIVSTASHDSINYGKSSDSQIGDDNLNSDKSSKSDSFGRNVLTSEDNDRSFIPPVTEELSSNFSQLSLGNKSGKHADHSSEFPDGHSSSIDERVQHSTANFSMTNTRSNLVPENMPVLPLDYTSNSVENSSIDGQSVVSQDLIPNTYQSGATKVTDSVSQSGYDQWYNHGAPSMEMDPVVWYANDQIRPPPKQWNTPQQNVENYENIQQTSDFVNVEVVAPAALQKRDIYGSRDSINKETLDNDPKPSTSPKEATNIRDSREEANNIQVLSMQQQMRSHPPLQAEQMPDNYEFASNDRNTFLETGELTDSHQEHEPTPPSQDDENDEVPNDIPFLREVPGQSSSVDPRRNDPTGQENVQAGQRLSDPRRNDPSGQEQSIQVRNVPDRAERRDVLPGQERNAPLLRGDSETLERRNDPSGRERSLPPQQSRNDPSGEERYQLQSSMMEPSEIRQVLGRGNESEEAIQQTDAELRQIPGGASSNDATPLLDDRTTGGRIVTGSPTEAPPTMSTMQDQASDSRSKREEAVGASLESENQGISSSSNRRDSYEDVDDEGSRNSREESRERRRESSPDRRRYEYDRRKDAYYDRDREYDDDYYYDRRRAGDNDRPYNTRDDFERRDIPYRGDDDRKHHSRDDLDRHVREDMDRRGRGKEDLEERDGRRRLDDRRRDDRRGDDPRRRDPRDPYDSRYPRDPRDSRDRDFLERERRRDDRRSRRYDDYDIRDPYRRDPYYDDPYGRRCVVLFLRQALRFYLCNIYISFHSFSSRPSSRSSYNDRDREYYMRARDPYYAYNGTCCDINYVTSSKKQYTAFFLFGK